MMAEVGSCSGIENYSRHIDGRSPGQAPHHSARLFPQGLPTGHRRVPCRRPAAARPVPRRPLPQGDPHRARFPAPLGGGQPATALRRTDGAVNQCIFMSATPSAYEISVSNQVVEQIVRPTGLIDPEVVVRPTKGQIDDLMTEVSQADRGRRQGAGDHADQENGRGPDRLPPGTGPKGALPALQRRDARAHRDPEGSPLGRVRRTGRDKPAPGGPRPARGLPGGRSSTPTKRVSCARRHRSSRRSGGQPATSTAP